MTGVVVNSDVLIDVLRQRKPALLNDWRELANTSQAIYCSPISAVEVRHGVREHERQVIEHLFSALSCLPIGEEVGRVAGDYLRGFHKSHGVELGHV